LPARYLKQLCPLVEHLSVKICHVCSHGLQNFQEGQSPLYTIQDSESVKTRKTNHARLYLPKGVTSHPQSWSYSAVWVRFCGNKHRLYMPFVWHFTIAMTRSSKTYCHLLQLSNWYWLNCVPALRCLSQTTSDVLGQWFLPHR